MAINEPVMATNEPVMAINEPVTNLKGSHSLLSFE